MKDYTAWHAVLAVCEGRSMPEKPSILYTPDNPLWKGVMDEWIKKQSQLIFRQVDDQHMLTPDTKSVTIQKSTRPLVLFGVDYSSTSTDLTVASLHYSDGRVEFVDFNSPGE